ncbi:MAG TPA: AarF/UbiB family protein [Longimicrobium sp.]|nr:AarF/UbiB family protein [Longimicrobium sp.]
MILASLFPSARAAAGPPTQPAWRHGEAVRPALRALELGWHAAAAAVRLGARLAAGTLTRGGETRASITGRTLAEGFEALGPAFVKLGQLLGTRRDLLGDDALRHLARLQDGLAPGPFGVVAGLFRAELGVETGAVFAELDPTPVASASIATVYRGRLYDGRVVAVKVRRPGVARRIGTDLRLLRAGARLLARLPPFRLIPVEATLAHFCACLERQLDFRAEAAACRRLRAALACEPGVVIPALVDELCGPSILTMEFIPGLRAHPARGGPEARQALGAAVRALYRMIFQEGCVHCDLHRGNLGFLRGGRAVLLDFGFVAEIGRYDRVKFAEFFLALATGDGARCARVAREMALAVPPGLDYAAFEAEVAALVAEASGARAGEFLVARFVGRLFDIQRRHGLRGTPAFVMPILSLLVLEGIVRDEDPGFDFQREARPFVVGPAVQALYPRPGLHEEIERAREADRVLPRGLTAMPPVRLPFTDEAAGLAGEAFLVPARGAALDTA